MKKNKTQKFDSNYPWEGDALSRQSTGEYFTKLVETIEDPFVICLKSSYGTGKTNFLNRWKLHLENENFPAVIYFNAWATDYASDALAALMSSIKAQLPSDDIKELIDKVDRLTMYGLKAATENGAALFLVTQGATFETAKATIGAGKKAVKKAAAVANGKPHSYQEVIEKFEKTENAIKDFKSELASVVNKVSKRKKSKASKRKIIILIDELDRCRPNYAIEVLECIKHLFDVEGVIFVIAADNEQLNNAVSSVYGERFDGESYLKKFFDWQLNLPEPSIENYTKFLFTKFGFEDFFSRNSYNKNENFILHGPSIFKNSFSAFARCFALSLREQDQCFTNLDLVIRGLDDNEWPLCYPLALLAVVQSRTKFDEFKRICLNQIREGDLDLTQSGVKRCGIYNPDNKNIIDVLNTNSMKFSHLWKFFTLDIKTLKKETYEKHYAHQQTRSFSAQEHAQLQRDLNIRKEIEAYFDRFNPNQDTIAKIVFKKLEQSSFLIEENSTSHPPSSTPQ